MDLQPLPLYEVLSVTRLFTVYLQTYQPGFRFHGERHDIWELSYLISGNAGVTAGEQLYECSEGDMILHRPGIFHSCWAMGQSSFKILTITFQGEGLDYTMPSGLFRPSDQERAYLRLLMEELPGLFAYRDDETKPLVYAAPPQSEGYQMVKNYVELLCLSLRRRGGASALQPAKHAYSERFANSVAYLRAHVCDGVSLQDLCRHVGESPGTVKHLFRTFTGGGAMQYYRYLRCQHCIALLEQGQSMGDIAAAMNFSSQNYLSTFFKREMGVSPSEYLRQNASGPRGR